MARWMAMPGLVHTSINASNANAAGDEFALSQEPGTKSQQVTMEVVPVGGPSALRVDLEASVGGVQWVALASMTDPAGGVVSAETAGFKHFRANKVSSTGGTNVTVTLSFGGS